MSEINMIEPEHPEIPQPTLTGEPEHPEIPYPTLTGEPEHPEIPYPTLTGEPEHPEIPYPLPPERTPPRRTEPVHVPTVSIGGDDARHQLSAQRRILVGGPLDHDAVVELAAELMAFDGESARDVEVVISSSGGPLADVFPALDVLGLVQARTNTTCIGSVSGTAVALAACGTGTRRAVPTATLCLRVDDRHSIEGPATEIVRRAAALEADRERLVDALVRTTRLDRERAIAEIDRGRPMSAVEARELGLVDETHDPASTAP